MDANEQPPEHPRPANAGDPAPAPGPEPEVDPEADPEPETDPDSAQRLAEERSEPPHPASRFDAGAGQGTVSGPPRGERFQDRPILDGSTQAPEVEATVPNPHRGQTDPATITQQPALTSTKTDRWLISSTVAAAVVTVALLLLARFDPVWSGVGIVVALLGLLGMLAVRLSGAGRAPRLRLMAGLMAITWLVPLAVILSIMIGRADQVWP